MTFARKQLALRCLFGLCLAPLSQLGYAQTFRDLSDFTKRISVSSAGDMGSSWTSVYFPLSFLPHEQQFCRNLSSWLRVVLQRAKR